MLLRKRSFPSSLALGACSLLAVIAIGGCSRNPQATRDHHLAAGKKLFANKDYGRAILEFKNAAQAAPRDAEPYYQLGLANLAVGDLQNAIPHFKKAIELNPKHLEAQKQLSGLMAGSRDPETLAEAARRLQEVLKLTPGDADALNLRAVTEYKLGHMDEAEASLRQALQNSPAHVRSLMNLASLKLAKKDSQGAEQILKQATEAAPRSPEAWLGLGRFYLAAGKLTDAGAQFQKAVEVAPKNADALYDLGRFQVTARQSDQAEQTFRRLADLPDPQTKTVYGTYLLTAGKKDLAAAEFQRLMKLDPKNRDFRTALVAAYLAAGKPLEAERTLDEALKKNPRDTDARLQRAEFHLQAGRLSRARLDADQAVRGRSEDPRTHYMLAKVHGAEGNDPMRAHELTTALQMNPSMLRARVELAGSLTASGKYASALAVLNEAPAHQKQALPLLAERNWALLGSGDLAEARRGIESCLAAGRTSDLLVQYGMLKLKEKKTAAARADLEEALKLNPNDLRAVQVLAASYFAEKREAAAISAVKPYLEKQANSPQSQMYLGELLLRSGDRAGARKAFSAAKQLSPELADPDLMLARLDLSEGKVDSARNALLALLAAQRGVEQAALLLGGIEQQAGNPVAAAEFFRKAMDANTTNWVSVNNLAACLSAAGKHDEALKYAQKAKELNPNHPAVADTLGWSLYNKALFTSAVKELGTLANNGNAVHQYHLAMAYMKTGQLAKGRDALKHANALDRNIPEAKMAYSLYTEVSRQQTRQ